MFDLRFIKRDEKNILQVRCVPAQIKWTKEYGAVFGPQNPIISAAERNYTEWEDVPFVEFPSQQPAVVQAQSAEGNS